MNIIVSRNYIYNKYSNIVSVDIIGILKILKCYYKPGIVLNFECILTC